LQYFQTRFLKEADKFIADLDRKAARKVLYNIDLAEQSNDPKPLKSYRKTSGNLEQILAANKFGCLHFGTMTTKRRP
jgi:phage-related protein